MKKNISFILFAVLLISEMLGIKLGVSQGLSAKNILMYVLLTIIGLNAALSTNKGENKIGFAHAGFLFLIIYAFISWQLTSVAQPLIPGIDSMSRLTSLKGMLVDHYLFFIIFYYSITTIKDGIWMVKSMLVLIFLTTAITIVDVYDIPDLGIIKQMERGSNAGRVQGPLGEPNQYASFLVLFIPSYIGMAYYNRGVKSGFYQLASVLSLVALLLTGSRGGLLGLFGGAVIGARSLRKILNIRQMIATTFKFGIVVLFALTVVSFKYSHVIMGRLEATTEAKDATTASAGRLWIWEEGIKVMQGNPLSFITGMGWDTYAGYVGVVSHNTFLAVLFELGLLGLCAYLAIIRGIYKSVKTASIGSGDEERIVISSFLFGFLSLYISLFFVNLFNPWFFIWAYMGVVMKVSHLSTASGALVK